MINDLIFEIENSPNIFFDVSQETDEIFFDVSQEIIEFSVEGVVNLEGGNGNGKSAYEIALDNGFVGSEIQWLLSLKGERGLQGEKGDQGLQGLKGDKGNDGTNGINGVNGINGKSAFEIAVLNGFSGTESDWILSLKGQKGDVGATGAQGIQGIQGIQGVKGDTGLQGIQGLPGSSVNVILASSESNAITLSAANPNNIYYWV